MNNLLNLKLTRNDTVYEFMEKNDASYLGKKAILNAYGIFKNDRLAAKESAVAAGIDNSGFSEEKLIAKKDMCFFGTCLVSSAHVILNATGNSAISNQMEESESYYLRAADSESAVLLQGVHALINKNLALITVDYVTPAELLELQAYIDTFTSIKGSSESVHKVSPLLTNRSNSDIKKSTEDINDLRRLIRKLKRTDSEFYNGFNAVAKTDSVAVHHTNLNLELLDEAGLPAAGVTAILSNTKKTGMSDAMGKIPINEVHNGKANITLASPDFKPYSTEINILVGKTNVMKISLERIIQN